MKIYAWVKSETCVSRDAVRTGTRVGRDGESVSRHGDYNRWPHGKRAALAIIGQTARADNSYQRQCARLVANLLDWN